jgi:hypothetical protein
MIGLANVTCTLFNIFQETKLPLSCMKSECFHCILSFLLTSVNSTKVSVVVETFDSATRQVIVKDLSTPMGVYPHAILRCSDVIICFTSV